MLLYVDRSLRLLQGFKYINQLVNLASPKLSGRTINHLAQISHVHEMTNNKSLPK